MLVLQYLVGRGYPTCGAATERKIEKLAPEPGPLRARSCIVDGEAVACDGNSLAVFELLRYRRRHQIVTLCAFDLIEREGKDLRMMPIEERKHALANLLCGSHPGVAFNPTRLTVRSSTSTPATLAKALLRPQ